LNFTLFNDAVSALQVIWSEIICEDYPHLWTGKW